MAKADTWKKSKTKKKKQTHKKKKGWMWKPDGSMAWQTGQCICHVQHLNGGGNFGFPNRWCWGTQQSCSHWQGVQGWGGFFSLETHKLLVEYEQRLTPRYFLCPPPGIHWERLWKMWKFSSLAWEFIFPVLSLPSSCSEIISWQGTAQDVSADKNPGGIIPPQVTEGAADRFKTIRCRNFF